MGGRGEDETEEKYHLVCQIPLSVVFNLNGIRLDALSATKNFNLDRSLGFQLHKCFKELSWFSRQLLH